MTKTDGWPGSAISRDGVRDKTSWRRRPRLAIARRWAAVEPNGFGVENRADRQVFDSRERVLDKVGAVPGGKAEAHDFPTVAYEAELEIRIAALSERQQAAVAAACAERL